MQDFDKLEGILKEYREFLEDSDSIDMTLPLHANLAGFEEEGLKIAVHVSARSSLPCTFAWPMPAQMPFMHVQGQQ